MNIGIVPQSKTTTEDKVASVGGERIFGDSRGILFRRPWKTVFQALLITEGTFLVLVNLMTFVLFALFGCGKVIFIDRYPQQ